MTLLLCTMSESSSSSQVVAGTSKAVDKQQLSEFQKRVRTELGRIRQQMRLKRADEVKVDMPVLLTCYYCLSCSFGQKCQISLVI